MKLRMTTLLTTFLILFSMNTSAKEEGPGKKRPHGRNHEIFQQLNLDEKQKKQISEIGKEHREKMKTLRQQKEKQQEKIKQAILGDAEDDNLRNLHKELQKINGQLSDVRLEKMFAIRKILTPEQKKTFLKHKAENRDGQMRRAWRRQRNKKNRE